MKESVKLHGTGRWNDEVGVKFTRAATDATNTFNRALSDFYSKIEKTSLYKESDVAYESQKSQILSLKAELTDGR